MPNVDKISSTFCPAKWDEININTNYNWVYACCKATPIKFDENFKSIIAKQKLNLLNDIQDPSCVFCWENENKNTSSLRQQKLKHFNENNYKQYLNINKPTKLLEVNLGNSCNLQCEYCNSNFSSEWEKDLKAKSYPIFTDRFYYSLTTRNKNVMDNNFKFINDENPEILGIIGGEPLINTKLWNLLDSTSAKVVKINSNFMVNTDTLDKLLSYEDKFEIDLKVSLDATKLVAEYVRHKLDFDQVLNNIEYYISKSKSGSLGIISLMTSVTICDIKNFYTFVTDLQNKFYNKNLRWIIFYCVNPAIHSFQSLPIEQRNDIIEFLKTKTETKNITGLDALVGALQAIQYDKGIHKQFVHFTREWDQRKNASLPVHIKEILCLDK